MVTLEKELACQRTTVIRVTQGFSQEKWVLDRGVTCHAKMAEDVVEGVLERLDVIDDILVKHASLGDLARLEFVDLVTDQMHGINLPIYRRLGFCYLVSESKIWLVLEGPASAALIASVVNHD